MQCGNVSSLPGFIEFPCVIGSVISAYFKTMGEQVLNEIQFLCYGTLFLSKSHILSKKEIRPQKEQLNTKFSIFPLKKQLKKQINSDSYVRYRGLP